MDGLEREPLLVGPPALCRVKDSGHPDTLRHPVFIVQIFQKDFVCVKACQDPHPKGTPGSYWMVRDGISWLEYLPALIRHFRAGLPVPGPFSPKRKIRGELLQKLEDLPAKELPAIFDELRRVGILPELPVLSRDTCPRPLAWEGLRGGFQDFRAESTFQG